MPGLASLAAALDPARERRALLRLEGRRVASVLALLGEHERAVTKYQKSGRRCGMRGKFITLEGIDGAGKSTHLQWLAQLLEERGIAVRATREPGGTALGERLRELAARPRSTPAPRRPRRCSCSPRAASTWRTSSSRRWRRVHGSCATASPTRPMPTRPAAAASPGRRSRCSSNGCIRGSQPDLTLLFDVDPEIGRQRARQGKTADRFEREEHAYFQRVREAYLRRARAAPGRVRVIDAGGSVERRAPGARGDRIDPLRRRCVIP